MFLRPHIHFPYVGHCVLRQDLAICEEPTACGLFKPSSVDELKNILREQGWLYRINCRKIVQNEKELEEHVKQHIVSPGIVLDEAIASKRLLWAIDYLRESLGHELHSVRVALEVGVVPRTRIGTAELGEVLSQKKGYTLVAEPTSFLEILRKLRLWTREPDLPNSVVILMDPEPRETMKEAEENTMAKQLRTFGFETHRPRVSGHHLPHQLSELIPALQPQ